MQLIGLTGGIAAGKSTIATRLAQHGAVIIDADRVAREIVGPGEPALERISERFGSHLVVDGVLDRAALGGIVFADPEALQDLEHITHPAVRARVESRISEHADDDEAVVVYDAPLLIEVPAPLDLDAIVVAHTPAELRVARLVDLRGMDTVEAERRVRSQASDAERLAAADIVIDTSGTLEHTLEQTDALWETISTRMTWPPTRSSAPSTRS